MQSIFRFKSDTRGFTYQPCADNRRLIWPILLGAGLILVFIVCLTTGIDPDGWVEIGSAVLGPVIFLKGLYEAQVRSRVTLTFDRHRRVIIRTNAFGVARQVMNFDQAGDIITEYEGGTLRYCLTRKGNLFGKNVPVSNYFKKRGDVEQRREFEELIMPAICEMLQVGGSSNTTGHSTLYGKPNI